MAKSRWTPQRDEQLMKLWQNPLYTATEIEMNRELGIGSDGAAARAKQLGLGPRAYHNRGAAKPKASPAVPERTGREAMPAGALAYMLTFPSEVPCPDRWSGTSNSEKRFYPTEPGDAPPVGPPDLRADYATETADA